MRAKYKISPHDLMTRECDFSIKDCSGVYKLYRINVFGDCVLRIKREKHVYETCATVSFQRRGELLLKRTTDGIVFEKRIKLSAITEMK